MICCNVSVLRAKGGESEDWGAFDFLSLPSPGDRIMIQREGAENYATVLSVHHCPSPAGQGEMPTAEVVAKWTGSGHKIR